MDRNAFVHALRTALMQLDDLQSLRTNPLLPLLCESGNPVSFQQRLLEGMERLQHHPLAAATQAYDILYFRFVEQMNQKEVAYQLGVSVRTLRRDQNNAIELLAEELREHFSLSPDPSSPSEKHGGPPANVPTPMAWESASTTVGGHGARSDLESAGAGTLQDEIAWLHSERVAEVCDPAYEIEKALQDAALVAEHYHVRIEHDCALDRLRDGDRSVSMPAYVLQQALLAMLTSAAAQARSGTLRLDCQVSTATLAVRCILPHQPHDNVAVQERMNAAIETLSQILSPFGGKAIASWNGDFNLTLVLPTTATACVLVIDDNPDVRQLLQRYAQQTRFRVIASDDPARAISLVQEHDVKALVLDVMMPEQSGWDLLAQWRHHPHTQEIPVAICTILPQAELASIMGAALFLPKPVTRTAFLAALQSLTALPGPAHD